MGGYLRFSGLISLELLNAELGSVALDVVGIDTMRHAVGGIVVRMACSLLGAIPNQIND